MEEKQENKISRLFKKLISILFIAIAGYFVVQWIMGDITSKPFAEITLKNIGSIILSFFITIIGLGIIKAFLTED